MNDTITIKVTPEIKGWIKKQPRTTNVSRLIREYLEKVMEDGSR